MLAQVLAPTMTWSWTEIRSGRRRLDDLAGEADVLLARLGVAARMVVDEDDRGGVIFERPADHLADVDRGLVDRAFRHRLVSDQHVPRVEVEDLAAICAWLADSHPEKGLIARPGSWERALHDQWVSFCLAELEAHLWSTARNSFLYPEEKRLPAVFEQNEAEGRRSLKVLDAHLATTAFLVGGRFTVADIIVGFTTGWAQQVGWTSGLDAVPAYNDRLRAMPKCPYGKG